MKRYSLILTVLALWVSSAWGQTPFSPFNHDCVEGAVGDGRPVSGFPWWLADSGDALGDPSTRTQLVPTTHHVVQVHRDADTAPGTFADPNYPFFAAIRALRGPETVDTYIEAKGWSSDLGWYTTKDYQLLYITEVLLDETGAPVLQDGQPVPLKADLYIWQEATYFSGEKRWLAIDGEVDLATGRVVGNWWSYGEDDPSSKITGAGTVHSFNTGERMYATDATGWVLRTTVTPSQGN